MIRIYMVLALISSSFAGLAQEKGNVTGKWKTSDGEAVFQIYQKGDFFYGKILSLREPNDEKGKRKMDKNNPDARLRSRPLVGLEILRLFKYAGDGVYDDGKIYDPKSGKTYSCKMTLEGTKLKIRGFIGVSLLGRTETWTRIP